MSLNTLTDETLAASGCFIWDTLESKAAIPRHWRVHGLMEQQSVNIVVGNSTCGKTPYAIQLGLSVASGLAFLDRPTQQGLVLYCDAESNIYTYADQVRTLASALGLSKPPREFVVWSPNWDPHIKDSPGVTLLKKVQQIKPDLVIVDTLRPFWPEMIGKNEQAAALLARMKATGIAWDLYHHKRKPPIDPMLAADLKESPGDWLMETAGAAGLINHTDTRLGMEAIKDPPGEAEILMGGIRRGDGNLAPMYLARQYDADGKPQCYKVASHAGSLSPQDLMIFNHLPGEFRYKDVQQALGVSKGGGPSRFIKRILSLGLAEKRLDNHYAKV